MEKYEIIYRKRFQMKFIVLINYLSTEWNLAVTDKFIETFESRIGVLVLNPYIGKKSSVLDIRSILITKHNRLYYRVKEHTVEILNMYDTRLNPKNNPYKK